MGWESIYKTSGAPDLFLRMEMDDLVDVPQWVKDRGLEFVDQFVSYRRQEYPKAEPGLMFIGGQGKGKSSLVAVLLKELIRRNKIVGTSRWLSIPLLSMTLKSAYATHEEELCVVRPYMEADILILDDLGAAHFTRPDEGVAWLEDRMFVIIEERYCRCRPILATSNLSKTSLAHSLGPRIHSRLQEMTDLIDMNEQVKGDHRRTMAANRGKKRG